MLVKILGWFWLIAGILFLLKPKMLKELLQKKSIKQLKKVSFGIAIFVGFWLLVAGLRSAGFLSKFLMVLGIASLVKALIFLRAKIADKIIAWLGRQSLAFFRLAACVHILLATIILLG